MLAAVADEPPLTDDGRAGDRDQLAAAVGAPHKLIELQVNESLRAVWIIWGWGMITVMRVAVVLGPGGSGNWHLEGGSGVGGSGGFGLSPPRQQRGLLTRGGGLAGRSLLERRAPKLRL